MRNKKGFTLIELLAIIVILAVIAVITVPIILNIIDNAEKGSAQDSALGYKDALQKYYATKSVQNPEQELPSGYMEISELPSDFTVSGENPSDGWVKLKNGIVEEYSLKYKDYVVTKYLDKDATTTKRESLASIVQIPDEYQEVEYLESTGTQYIDTGVYADINTKAEFEFEITSVENANSNIGLFGAEGSKQNIDSFAVNTNASKEYLFPQFGNKARTTISNLTFNINTKYKITLSKDGWYYDNTLGATWSNSTAFTTPLTLTLFKVNAVYANSQSKFYNTKIWNNNLIERNFIPVIRKSDNKPGMLDLATRTNNLFNKDNSVTEYYINSTGTIKPEPASSPWSYSDYIEVKSNTSYSFNVDTTYGSDAKHCFYDDNKNFISCINSGSQTFTTPANTKYARFSFRSTTTEIMLNEGTEALPYEPYGYKFYTNAGTGEFIAGPEI